MASVTALVWMAIGSQKCRVKKTFVKLVQPWPPCMSGMHLSTPRNASVAPIGWLSLKGLTWSGLYFLRAISPMVPSAKRF